MGISIALSIALVVLAALLLLWLVRELKSRDSGRQRDALLDSIDILDAINPTRWFR